MYLCAAAPDQFNRHRSRLPLNQEELLISNKLSRKAFAALTMTQLILVVI